MAPFLGDEPHHTQIHLIPTGPIDGIRKTSSPNPIAICGMALRLPGGISSPSEFWDFLIAKRDARGPVPQTRYNISAFHSNTGNNHSIKTQHGYFLDESIDLGALDTTFFSMSKLELERQDPQQRQLLEVTRECLESAGEVDYRGKAVGCFIGSFGEDWLEGFARDEQHHGTYRVSGTGDFAISNRLSYEFDFRGPSMTVRTACSSSLTALHQACLAIDRGECSAAVVGGASLILGPGMTIAMSEQGVLSPNGSCRTFDAAADGYARAEAINAVFIKPLSQALRDGNPIRAVIRSTAVNCDGKTPSLFLPSSESHEAMIQAAYSSAGLDPAETAFCELHGTGTPIGDPLEVAAIANVFGKSGIYIGSVKPNVGHSEAASGITSLIKSVLAIEHQIIPPNIKFDVPNPRIPFESKNLTVPVEPTPWPKDRPVRISVNSFGIGGANAHAILESPVQFLPQSPQEDRISNGSHLLVFSANTAPSLQSQIKQLNEYAQNHKDHISDLAYTLALRREHLPHRAYSLAVPDEAITISSTNKSSAVPANIVMIFTGQGAHWARMGAELLTSQPAFRECIQNLDRVLQSLPDAPIWRIRSELLKPAGESNVNHAVYSQPLCTAIQIALVHTLSTFNIFPTAVVGHSSGEMAAAVAAGKMTAKEAIIAAYYRGIVSGSCTRKGGMAAIGMGWDETSKFLVDGVVIACENSPSSVTISGDEAALDEVLANVRAAHPGVLARPLKINRAYHSHHMRDVGKHYQELTQGHVLGNKPNDAVLFFSSVSGNQVLPSDSVNSEYWQSNLESPVRFRTAVANLLHHFGSRRQDEKGRNLVFLEIGPHAALAGPLRQILTTASLNSPYISAMMRGENCTKSLLAAVGQLHLHNVMVDFNALTNTQGAAKVLTDLPPYPWQHDKSFWYETRLMKEWRHRKYPHHELLGSRIPASTDNEQSWRNVLSLESTPWVRDHNIKGDVIFPCAGYVGMIAEAARQLSLSAQHSDGRFHGCTLRQVVVSTALVLDENKTTEIITTLTRHRYTQSLDSEWFDFAVSSHNGITWTKHCAGQVSYSKADNVMEYEGNASVLSREVDVARFYDSMRQIGANYGPHFQGLQNIRTATTSNAATANAVDTLYGNSAPYLVHPTTLDTFLQLFAVASVRGIGRKLEKMTVPTNFEEIKMRGLDNQLTFIVSASTNERGVISGSGDALASNGKAVLSIKGARFTPLENDELESNDPHAAAICEWQPDIDFTDPASLISQQSEWESITPLLNRFAYLCAEESLHRLSGLQTTLPHMQKFRSWLEQHVQSTSSKNLNGSSVSDENEFSRRAQAIEVLFAQIGATSSAAFGVAMKKVLDNISAIFTGTTDALGILLADGTLTHLYNAICGDNNAAFIQALAHKNPTLRVLEIGAGTGGTTALILRSLTRSPGLQHMYAQYTYTDISAGFFAAAKDRFKQWPNLVFATLDISKDPLSQGFDANTYDLIIAANVLHATPNLRETLTNVHKLLHPDGRLLMIELNGDCKAINYIMGILPGWWLGDADGRPDEPYVSVDRWDMELKGAGFNTLDAAVLNAVQPFQHWASLVATSEQPSSEQMEVALLCDESTVGLSSLFHKELTNYGLKVISCTLQNLPPMGLAIFAIIDLQTPFFGLLTHDKLKQLQHLLSHMGEAGIFWLTQSSSTKCVDPRFAQTLGAARSIRSETALDFATCEVDNIEASVTPAVEVFRKFLNRRCTPAPLEPELEFAILDGQVKVGRYFPFSVSEELLDLGRQTNISTDPRLTLSVGSFGQPKSLKWTAAPSQVLTKGEVRIDIQAVGMNFKDVLILMGVVSGEVGVGDRTTSQLGVEGAGIVREIGPEVDDLAVGDHVFLIQFACFTTSLVVPSNLCARIPKTLGFVDAATMPCVFATVIASLIEVGRLQKGQSVLIHSACGGVGIAAIQISKMIGAEIYTTVGNDEKVEYLMSNFGIPRHRIFNSRDASFLKDLMKETNGRGVDLVLNSLSGELLHKSWECVAEFGMLVEIGKRDLQGHGKLEMSNFEANRTYSGFDLTMMVAKRPEMTHKLLKQIVKYYEDGHIQPVRPTKVFGADAISECFIYMQKGQHLGKIVVSMSPQSRKRLSVVPAAKSMALDSKASFLLVGGLGGLGKPISRWLIEHGARNLVYLSRNAGTTPADKAFFLELESQGCSVTGVKGSVSDLADVKSAVAAAKGNLKGVLQMSMVLRDNSFSSMTFEEWTAAVTPKVQGTWNLHQATLETPLDFFVGVGSISAIIGQHGQANYAAGNAFMDAFVKYRHGLGLAASCIDVGAMEDAGYVAENMAVADKLRASGIYFIRESQLLDALTIAISVGDAQKSTTFPSQFAIGLRSTLSHSDPANRMPWAKERRMAMFQYIKSSDSTASKGNDANDKLKAFLAKAAADPDILTHKSSATFLARQICRKLFESLLRPVDEEEELDTSMSLTDAGLDSLVAIEMRSWWKKTLGFNISVLEMLGMGSINALGELAAKGLTARFGADEVKGSQARRPEQVDVYVGKLARYVTEEKLPANVRNA